MYVTHIINQSGQTMPHYNVGVQNQQQQNQQQQQILMNNNNNTNIANIVQQQAALTGLLTPEQIAQQVIAQQVAAATAAAVATGVNSVVVDPTQQQPQQPPVKKRAKKACLNCRSSKVACDHNRPCLRCTKHGIEDSCLDIPRKPKVVGKRIKKDANSSPSGALTTEPILLSNPADPNAVAISTATTTPARTKKNNKSAAALAAAAAKTTVNYIGTQDISSLVNSIKNNPHLQQQLPHYLNLTANNANANNKSQPPSPTITNLAAINQSSNVIQTTPGNASNSAQQMFKFVGTDMVPSASPLSSPLLNSTNNINANLPSPQQPLNSMMSPKEENDMNASGNNLFIPYVFNNNNNNNNNKEKDMSQIVEVKNESNFQGGNMQFISSPNMNGNSPASSIPSSPQSAFSTPSPSISAYSSDSSPASPHAQFDVFQNSGAIDYQLLQQQQQIQISQNSLCHPYADHNNNNEDKQQQQQSANSSAIQSVVENVCANLSSLISTSANFQDPIGVGQNPFGYCLKSPFQMDGTQSAHQQQQNQLQITNYSNHQQQLMADNMIQSIFNGNLLTNNNNNNNHSITPVHTILPDVLITEFKKIHQSLETITSFLQFPTIQRPLYSPTPKNPLIPGGIWLPCSESVKKYLPTSRWAFPDRYLLDINDSFAKLLGFKSESDLRTQSPQLTWDDIVHFQVIQFTNRYAMEAVIKGIRKFQRPCLFKRKQGGYLSVTILVNFDTCYQSFEVSILQKHNETNEEISPEYIIREYRFKNACLELDDINH